MKSFTYKTLQLAMGRIVSAEGQWHTNQNEAKQRTGDWKRKKRKRENNIYMCSWQRL